MMFVHMENHQCLHMLLLPLLPAAAVLVLVQVVSHEVLVLVEVSHVVSGVMDHKMIYKTRCTLQ
jgi:hypothetical protein